MKIEHYCHPINDAMINLLLEADPNIKAIHAYLPTAKVLVASSQDEIIGIAVLTDSNGLAELKNIAVCRDYRGQGIAKCLIEEVKIMARQNGHGCLYVGTGNSSLSQLALYQKCGFRLDHIKHDFFADYPQEIYENGIRCLDLVVLCARL